MLAEVSVIVAALFVTGAVGIVAALILIGLRQRLELEIPPRRWEESRPLTPTQQRAYVGLFLVGLGFWGLGLIGVVASIRWLFVAGMAVFLAAMLGRIGINIHRMLQVRRSRRAREFRE